MSSSRDYYDAQIFNVEIGAAQQMVLRADFLCRPSVMLGLVPKLDGDQYCALYGSNLQEGIAGFGDTPDAAMKAFDQEWYKAAPDRRKE